MRVLSSIFPFAEADSTPLEILARAGLEHVPNPFDRRMSENELISMAAGVDAIICGTEPITAAVIDAAQNLKVIARVGSGYDSVDLSEAGARGISVTITPDGPVESVAELTVGLALAACRNLACVDRGIRRGEWMRPLGRLLAGRTVGVAGVSRIGEAVARKFQALGCTVIGHDIRHRSDLTIPFVDKAELLAQSDILTIHLASSPATQGWLAQAELAAMRNGSIVINAARGGIVDEDALYSALRSGNIFHAALDVFQVEPYTGPLAQLPNVTLTSHIGSMTAEARVSMEVDACRSVVDVLNGRTPQHPVV